MRHYILATAVLCGLVSCAPKSHSADEIPIQDCGSNLCVENIGYKESVTIAGSKAEIQSITFDGCSGYPCVVHQGETAIGQLSMKANSATDTLTCKVVLVYCTFYSIYLIFQIVGIIVGGIELPFNGCNVNACDNLSTGDCPVEEGEMLVYDISIPILSVYPKLEITGKIMLKDDMGEDFLCFTIPMKIE